MIKLHQWSTIICRIWMLSLLLITCLGTFRVPIQLRCSYMGRTREGACFRCNFPTNFHCHCSYHECHIPWWSSLSWKVIKKFSFYISTLFGFTIESNMVLQCHWRGDLNYWSLCCTMGKSKRRRNERWWLWCKHQSPFAQIPKCWRKIE